ncbi:hypothetical protein VUR80DRAFT_9105 [Thermomyces stellatus]
MEAIFCACMLANLEGVNNTPPEHESLIVATLSALDIRAQKLEGSTPGLLAPPPTTPLTWNSLAWRVARVANSGRFWITYHATPKVPLDASLDLLDSIVESINIKVPGTIPVSREVNGATAGDEGDGEDEKTVCDDNDADGRRLDLIRQRLCFAVGRRGMKIGEVSYDLSSTCSLAPYLALDIEKTASPLSRPRKTTAMPPPRPPQTITITRRCKCRCNRKKVTLGRRVYGFFTSLAWWKKKRWDDDGSGSDTDSFCGSSTTSSSWTR